MFKLKVCLIEGFMGERGMNDYDCDECEYI